MSDQDIQIEKDGHVLVIRFTNDEMRNSLSPAMRDGLANAIHEAADDHTVRALYITGSGRSFCAGGRLLMVSASHRWLGGPTRPRAALGALS